jgi:hypothetical protein
MSSASGFGIACALRSCMTTKLDPKLETLSLDSLARVTGGLDSAFGGYDGDRPAWANFRKVYPAQVDASGRPIGPFH